MPVTGGSVDGSQFVQRLLKSCLDLRSLWLLGDAAAAPEREAPALPWEMIGFADERTLSQLRYAEGLHRPDVRLFIVTDNDRFESAWGQPASGRLALWEWRLAGANDAFFSQAQWQGSPQERSVERVRRRAVRIWPVERSAA